MRRLAFLAFITLALLSFTVPQLMAQQDDNSSDAQQATNSVLQWVDSEPLTGAELGLDMPIELYFDRPIDCATVADAFTITPSVDGAVNCDGTSLTFTPADSFERASTYIVMLDTDLRGIDGAQLFESLLLIFNTVGFIQITETFPSPDTFDIQLDTTITVIFNRPIVPLTLFDDQENLINPLTISPALEGTGEWINTSIYVFEPSETLRASTDYTVTIAQDLTAQDGSVLPEDYTFSFTTQAPIVLDFMPSVNEESVALDRTIQVRFNMAMDQQSVEDNFTLQEFEYESGDINEVSGTFEWADDGAGFRFTPDDDLVLNTFYEYTIEAGVLGINGGNSGLDESLVASFTTVPYPRIVSTTPNENILGNPYSGFAIYFSSAMAQDQFAEFITIDPEPEFEPRYYWRSWNNTLEVAFQPYASADYTITIDAGLEDEYGNTIDEAYTFSYTTDAFSSEVGLRVPGGIGFYNAERDPTSVFVTYRNVEEFDVSLYDVDLQTFGEYMIETGYFYRVEREQFADDSDLITSWTVDGTQIPENALRFDLLEFNNSVGAISCSANLPTRLFDDSMAIVVADPDPVRARSVPVDGEIVDLLYLDYALPILDAPVCGSDGLLWYPVELRDGTAVWVAESVGEDYLIAPIDGTQTTAIEVGDEDAGLDPGIYFLQASNYTHVMVVSNANLVVKHTLDSMMIWVTDVQTGLPIPNAPITIYGDDNSFIEIASGFTDQDGILMVESPRMDTYEYERRLAIMDTDTHFGIGFTEWSDGIDPYLFGQSYNYFPNEYTAYLYTDRPVYRPGQPVYLRGTVRQQDDVSFTPPDLDVLAMTISNSVGETIFEGNVSLNEYGSFDFQLDLSDDARLGYYNVTIEVPDDRDNYYSQIGFISFNVAEYRLPEFLVDVTANTPEVVQGDTISVTVDSTYFFGGSVSDASVDYTVASQNFNFRYEGAGRYDFVDYNYDAGPSAFYASNNNGAIASGSDVTNAEGEFTIEIPAELADASQSQTYFVEATVRDETGQSVSGRGEVIVHQGLVYVGASADSYVTTAGDDSTINIVAVDWASNPVANQQVTIEVVDRQWSSVQERDENGTTVWTWELEEIPITDGEVITNASGTAQFNFTPETGGSFKVYVTTTDERGNEVRSSTYVWVSSSRYVSWRQQNSNRIDLIASAEDYSVGDTAEILITSPFQGTSQALITVERGDVLSHDLITMDSNSYLYELPITENYAPNVFVSVMIIKGVDETNPVAGFRMGYVQFNVGPQRRELLIDIQANTDRSSPQETVTYTVQTTDWAGNPVSAEVGVAVTDLAALSLAAENTRPIFNYFFSDQYLAVRTATPLTINTDQITQEVLDTVKGGGGGGAGDAGIIEVRGEFVDTPYWNPSIITDENGQATFDVRLPDNLTTWRLNARGVTLALDGNLLVGQNTFDLLSTKPILIRPVTPRFFVVGDEVVLSAVVNNNTETSQDVVVTLHHEGVTLLDSQSAQLVTIAPDARARVTWTVLVDDADVARFSFTADAGNFTDGAISAVSLDDEGTIPIYRYAPPEVGNTVGTAGVLETAESRVETIYLPERFEVTEGVLTVQVDQSLAASTLDSLDALSTYGSSSTNATVSSFLPNILSYRALNRFGLADVDLENQLLRNANFAIQKLSAEQHSDGGWGWHVNSRSNPSTTAYVLLGLVEASEQGFAISPERIVRAQEYLRANFISIDANIATWEANRQAFILYALARSGNADIARAEVLYRNRDDLSLYAQALLAETFWYIDPTDSSRTDLLLNDLLNVAITGATGIHWQENYNDYWNWNTDTRTTALVLNTLTKIRPNSDLIPNVVRYLMVQRRADQWETTQETAWAVMALTNWMIASGELNPDYAYDISLNGETRVSGQATDSTVRDSNVLFVDVADLLQGEANRLVFTRTGSNEGNLYYTAYLTAYLSIPDLEPISNGVTVTRSYSLQQDPDGAPITSAIVGDIVEVRLNVIVPNALHYVQIYDPLPAGAEGIDPNLTTNAQIGTRPSINRTNPLRYGWGWWWFSTTEFRDEAVVMYADYLPAGTYEYVYTMRAGVEGTYNVIPPSAQQVYFPDVYGRGEGMSFTINPSE
ncbi:MAG: hypothetical protein Phog2KO_10640 [Phototrophicaceae bacterium]